MANPSSYGDEFTQQARVAIQSAIEHLARFDDMVTNEQLHARLRSMMSSTQIEEAEREFQRDLLEIEGGAVGSTHALEDGASAAGPGPAWINTLV